MDGLPALERAVLLRLRHTGSARDSAHTSQRGVGWARPTMAVQMHMEMGDLYRNSGAAHSAMWRAHALVRWMLPTGATEP